VWFGFGVGFGFGFEGDFVEVIVAGRIVVEATAGMAEEVVVEDAVEKQNLVAVVVEKSAVGKFAEKFVEEEQNFACEEIVIGFLGL